jgi:serine/threonine protein kinase
VVFQGQYKFISVAIKKMSLNYLGIKEIKNVLNELVILERLKHPNIMMVLGYSLDTHNNLYLVSELYPEKNLKVFLEQK